MEVSFSADTEEQLQDAAASAGKTPVQFVKDTVAGALARRAEFLAGVDRGIAAAERGDFIEHEEAIRRIDRIFQR